MRNAVLSAFRATGRHCLKGGPYAKTQTRLRYALEVCVLLHRSKAEALTAGQCTLVNG